MNETAVLCPNQCLFNAQTLGDTYDCMMLDVYDYMCRGKAKSSTGVIMIRRVIGSFLISQNVKHYILVKTTVKPLCNDHLYNKIYYLWLIQ